VIVDQRPSQSDEDREVLWQPKQHAVAQSVHQYSKFVRIMKIALPAAAAVLLLLVVLLPVIREQEDRFRIGATSDKENGGATLSMTNARFYGTDDKGEPYSLTAQGVRQVSGSKIVELSLPKAEITLNNGTWLSASADKGVFDRDKQVIDLSGNVSVYQYQNNELHTSQARIMLKDGTAHGDAPVTGQGPFGTIQAGGFDYNSEDKKIRFTGGSKLVINTKPKPDAEKHG
jgi:lipopolysaccharide export system protein LptC